MFKHIFEDSQTNMSQNPKKRLDFSEKRRYLRNKSSYRVLPAERPGEGFTPKQHTSGTTNVYHLPQRVTSRESHMSTGIHAIATPGFPSGVTSRSTIRSTNRSTTRVRLTRRGRRVLLALIVVPIIIVMVWAALNGGIAVATSEVPTTSLSYVTVNTDESLWDIAQREAPQADTRAYVDELIRLNNLRGEIQPGQRLALPVVG